MSRGGWRFGAGRPGWRRKCEDLISLDVRHLKRSGWLMAGGHYSWSWGSGENKSSVRGFIGDQGVTLNYTWSPEYGPSRQVNCRIGVVDSQCHFGGSRQWFICPACSRRCAIVYGVSRFGHFACRVCQDLAYASEAESSMDRLARKIGKLEQSIIDRSSRLARPRLSTVDRICKRIQFLEQSWESMYGALFVDRPAPV